jgi:phosphoglucomutase
MASLLGLKDRFDVAFANDTDADRHGIVTPSAGLLNPNHYLAVAIHYLLTHRPGWSASAAIGKTLVSSSLIDRVVAACNRRLLEVPVGFKWFAPGLLDRSVCFGGEESAGASFLRRMERCGPPTRMGSSSRCSRPRSPRAPARTRVSTTASSRRSSALRATRASMHRRRRNRKARSRSFPSRRCEPPHSPASRSPRGLAPGNDAPIGGLKVVTAIGWFAARPSGTENLYKIYAESFRDERHLRTLVAEAQQIVAESLRSS